MSSASSSFPSSMANHSISNFSTQTTHEFDVFISFTGKTRCGFTSHLVKELKRIGLRTFTDDQLPKGEAISDGLIHHIKRSRSTIVVISQDFAASPSCLDELLESFRCMADGEHPIFPIFYKLHPSELRRLNGRTVDYLSLHDHSLGKNSDRVAWWKTCLVLLSDMAGWHFNNWSGNESEFIKRIANQINTTRKKKKAAVPS